MGAMADVFGLGEASILPIRKLWAEHLSCRGNRQYHLSDVLMFQAWLEAQ